jgi:antitoxin ParD1/3/4
MHATMNVSLPPDLKKWIDQQAREGGFATAEEYMRDMLRRARERQAKRQIDAMLIEAVESGATTVMDDDDWTSIRKSARASAKSHAKRRR